MNDSSRLNSAVQLPSESGNGRPWLDNLDKPWWLKNDFYANEWRIFDESPAKPKRINWDYPLYDPVTGKVSLLTDPENAPWLETAQLFSYGLRNSQITTDVTSSISQHLKTNILLMTLAWMRLNFINSIDELEPIHFKLFMEAVPWGPARLLEVDRRFDEYVEYLKSSGQKMPVRKVPYGSDVIAVRKMYLQIGVPADGGFWGHAFAYKLWSTVVNFQGKEFVSPENRHYLKDCDPPVEKPLTEAAIRHYVSMWQNLHDLSHILPQKCTVNPARDFIPGEDLTARMIAKEAANRAGIEYEEGITETIPDEQGFFLVDRAIRWVLMYSEDLLALRPKALATAATAAYKDSRYRDRLKTLLKGYPKHFSPDDPGAPWPLDAASLPGSTNLSIMEATGVYLMAACAIVIAVFSARRKMEVMNIKGGEPTEEDSAPRAVYIDQDGQPWLWTWIEKTLQKWDRVPIPQVVVKAIEVLEALTAETREETGSRNLFETNDGGRSYGSFNFHQHLNLFADFVGVPPLKQDGSKWIFKPHQFRRFFALLYMYRYKFGEHGKFEALSWHLRHLNMERTKRYVEEIYESDMLKAHSKHIVVDLMSDVLRKERQAAGPGGEAMKNQLSNMLREVIKNSEILGGNESPDVSRKIAERVMLKLGVEMVPFMWGYCYAYKDIDDGNFHGNCVKEGSAANAPDLARATPKNCYGCKHLYVDDDFKTYWEVGVKKYQQAIERGRMSDVMADMAKKNLAIFETALENYFND